MSPCRPSRRRRRHLVCIPAVSADAGDLALDNDQVGDDLERVKAELDKAVAAGGQLEMRNQAGC